MKETTFDKLVSHFKSQRRMAFALGVTPQSLGAWRHRRIPANRVLEIEKLVGGEVTRYEMRPDIFGDSAA